MLDKNIENVLIPFFEKEIPKQDFSNARLVRNIFEKAKFIQATRVIDDEKVNKDLITKDDIESAIEQIKMQSINTEKTIIGFSAIS